MGIFLLLFWLEESNSVWSLDSHSVGGLRSESGYGGGGSGVEASKGDGGAGASETEAMVVLLCT